MTWVILINTIPPYFKYYSIEYIAQRPTGRIMYGRIGHRGRQYHYSVSEVLNKRIEKINEGYHVFAINVEYPTPSEEQVRIGQSQSRPQIVKQTQTVARNSARQQRVAHISSRGIPIYKTNRQGYLMSYRSGYKRSEPMNYKVVGKDEIMIDSILRQKIKMFYNRIPQDAVYVKPLFNDSEQGIFGRKVGHFKFIIDDMGRPIGGYELVYNTGESNFLYIKTEVTNYSFILKYIFNMMGAIISNKENITHITIRVKGQTLINAIKSIFPDNHPTKIKQFKIYHINKHDLIALNVQQITQRWQK